DRRRVVGRDGADGARRGAWSGPRRRRGRLGGVGHELLAKEYEQENKKVQANRTARNAPRRGTFRRLGRVGREAGAADPWYVPVARPVPTPWDTRSPSRSCTSL